MANIEVNLKHTGFSKSNIMEHADVVEEINDELIEKTEKKGEFAGWINWPSQYKDSAEYKRIKRAAKKIAQDSDILLVIGIGGSYLGARAVIEALHSSFYEKENKNPRVIFVGNNLSSDYINDVIHLIEEKDFSINVISKSGTTTEPAIAFRIFREIIENKYGLQEAKKRIYVTTDSRKGALKKIAKNEEYETFSIPNNIGGRFSVFTAVGLLPIAVSGIDIDKLMNGAIHAEDRYSDKFLQYNECYQYSVMRNLLYESHRPIEVLTTYSPRLHYFTEWWKQLFGESEGKDGKGIFPVGMENTTDLHSLGQFMQDGERIMFETVINVERPNKDITINIDEDNLDELNYLAGKTVSFVNKKAMEATMKAHISGGVPNIMIKVKALNEECLGELMYFFEKACAMSAELMEVNPFNQPGVEEYKTNMFKLLKKPGYED